MQLLGVIMFMCSLALANSVRDDEFEKVYNRNETKISDLENKIEKGEKNLFWTENSKKLKFSNLF